MARIHGYKGRVSMDSDGASPFVYVEIADLNAWTLDMTRDRQVVTAFGDTNVQRVAGLPDFSGTLSGFWNSATTPTYFDAVLAGTPVQLKLEPNRDESTHFLSGLANIDGAIAVSATAAASISGNWDAAGNWTLAP
jgi:hypothetical protein